MQIRGLGKFIQIDKLHQDKNIVELAGIVTDENQKAYVHLKMFLNDAFAVVNTVKDLSKYHIEKIEVVSKHPLHWNEVIEQSDDTEDADWYAYVPNASRRVYTLPHEEEAIALYDLDLGEIVIKRITQQQVQVELECETQHNDWKIATNLVLTIDPAIEVTEENIFKCKFNAIHVKGYRILQKGSTLPPSFWIPFFRYEVKREVKTCSGEAQT